MARSRGTIASFTAACSPLTRKIAFVTVIENSKTIQQFSVMIRFRKRVYACTRTYICSEKKILRTCDVNRLRLSSYSVVLQTIHWNWSVSSGNKLRIKKITWYVHKRFYITFRSFGRIVIITVLLLPSEMHKVSELLTCNTNPLFTAAVYLYTTANIVSYRIGIIHFSRRQLIVFGSEQIEQSKSEGINFELKCPSL